MNESAVLLQYYEHSPPVVISNSVTEVDTFEYFWHIVENIV